MPDRLLSPLPGQLGMPAGPNTAMATPGRGWGGGGGREGQLRDMGAEGTGMLSAQSPQ